MLRASTSTVFILKQHAARLLSSCCRQSCAHPFACIPQALIQPLGLFRKRAAAIQQLSQDYLYKQVCAAPATDTEQNTSTHLMCPVGFHLDAAPGVDCFAQLTRLFVPLALLPRSLTRLPLLNPQRLPLSGGSPQNCLVSESTLPTRTTCSAGGGGGMWPQTTRTSSATASGWSRAGAWAQA